MTLKAEVRQQDSQTADEKTLRSERYFGSVARSFQLPADIDSDKARPGSRTASSPHAARSRAVAPATGWRSIEYQASLPWHARAAGAVNGTPRCGGR